MTAPKNQTQKIQLTQQGIDQLQAELHDLKEVKRPHTVARLANAREQGDLSENSDYISARDELNFIDGRIAELAEVLSNATVAGAAGKSSVSLGNQVTVKVAGKQQIFNIVGEWEADPKEKKISQQSPLGQALVGKRVGDVVEVDAPAGKIEYHIVSID